MQQIRFELNQVLAALPSKINTILIKQMNDCGLADLVDIKPVVLGENPDNSMSSFQIYGSSAKVAQNKVSTASFFGAKNIGNDTELSGSISLEASTKQLERYNSKATLER